MRATAWGSALVLAAGAVAQTIPAPAPAKPPARPPVRRAAPAIPSYTDLKYPPLREIKIPPIESYTLANGMKIYLLEDHELPVISGTALVRTGNLFDPPDKVGLASLTGTVIRSGGIKEKTGDQIDEELENIAASVESGIGETSGSVSFSALKENVDEVMGVFGQVLTAPEFRQDKIDLVKTQMRSGISRRNDDAGSIAAREFASVVYGRNNPYGWDIEYATVNAIRREDAVGFYRRYFFPANIMFAVRGDFSIPEMKTRIEKLFGGWNYQQPAVPPFPKVEGKPAPGIYLAVKNDVTQTFFTVGHLGGTLRDKDFAALEVMADILGGGFRSRLVQRVRTNLGYAYTISADWGADYDHPGLFEISGSTKSLSTVETLKAVREEVERIRTALVSEEELRVAKDTALNSFVFAFDTKAKTLGRILTYEYFGYPRDFIYQYQKALAAVTQADVLAVAKARIQPDTLTIVTVGKPEDFGHPLTSLGLPVSNIDLKIPEEKREAARKDAGTLAAGKKLLERVQQAVGGANKLAAVKDSTEISNFQIDASSGGLKATQTERWIAPTTFRQETKVPFGTITAYFDGKTGWIQTPQGGGPLAGAQLRQVQGDLFRLYFRLLLSDRMPERTANLIGDDTVEISDGENNATLSIDAKTGLPLRVGYHATQVSGPAMEVQETLSDFRDVSGIRMPFHVTIEQGGRKFADVTFSEINLNTGLKPEDLRQRP